MSDVCNISNHQTEHVTKDMLQQEQTEDANLPEENIFLYKRKSPVTVTARNKDKGYVLYTLN